MSFSNLEYLYNNLPSRFRREDENLFLKRFLQLFGEILDLRDLTFDNFFLNINPQTASEEWVEFWLNALFGWSYFPKGFTLSQKRILYANFAKHLARRGTARGIELFLKDFGVSARVSTKQQFWEECVFDEDLWNVEQPLIMVVEIFSGYNHSSYDLGGYDDSIFDESLIFSAPEQIIADVEIETLLRFQQPLGQQFFITFPATQGEIDIPVIPTFNFTSITSNENSITAEFQTNGGGDVETIELEIDLA